MLGNHRIYEIVQQGFYELRIDLEDFNNEKRYALYKRFYIDDETNGYRLHLEDYEGTAGIELYGIFKTLNIHVLNLYNHFSMSITYSYSKRIQIVQSYHFKEIL